MWWTGLRCWLSVAVVFPCTQQVATAGAPARIDNFGDPLPPEALARLGTIRLRQSDQYDRCALSPDGKTLVSGGADGWVHIWGAVTGRERVPPVCYHQWIHGLQFSPDGQRIAITYGATVLFLDATTFKEQQRLSDADNPTFASTYTPDGKRFVTVGKKYATLWDLATGQPHLHFKEHKDWVYSVAVSPDGKMVATGGSDKVLRLWDADSGQTLKSWTQTDRLDRLVFSPDSKLLVSHDGERIFLIRDTKTCELRQRFQMPVWYATVVAFRADGGGMATGVVDDEDGRLRLWDLQSGKEVPPFVGSYHALRRLGISADGKIMVHAPGSALRLLDARTGKDRVPLTAHQARISSLCFLPDNRTLATASYDGTVRLWDTHTARERERFVLPPDKLDANWRPGHFFSSVVHCAGSGRLVAGNNHGQLLVWDEGLKKLQRQEPAQSDWIFALAASPDGQVIASAGHEKNVYLWDAKTGKKVRTLTGHERTLVALAFFPDGRRLATGGGDGVVRIYDWTTGQLFKQKKNELDIRALAISPDGRQLVYALDGALGWWYAGFDTEPTTNPDAPNFASLAFAPDGRTLAAGGYDGRIHIWETGSRQVRRVLQGHRGWVQSLAFTSDGKRLASGSSDATVLLWDVSGAGQGVLPKTLDDTQLRGLWDDLAGADAARAFRAIRVLRAFPEKSLPLLRDKLRPVRTADPKHLKELLADLDWSNFRLRQRAMTELEKLGDSIVMELRTELKKKLSDEHRRRLEQLLQKAEALDNVRLQQLRAIEVLESLSPPEARALLQTLADGLPEA
ncbi:MAG TPA: WD40 repeat domain-containing protein, partial [Gemmataceae bacterium]|nr:WD40 repeat domain-containing protein [Gemmataceae bacterium]